jgi:undecaprenyl-diphosphatase
MRQWLAYLPLLLAAMLLLGFGLLADEVVEGDTLALDRMVLLWFREPGNLAVPIGPLWLQEAVRDVTSLGSFSLLGIVTIIAFLQLLLSGDRVRAIYLSASVVGGTIVSTILKILFDRPRPDIPGAPHVFTASFPSGHATLSGVVFLTLAAILSTSTERRRLQIFYLAVGVLLTIIVGMSRVYEGVHYPTDVLAGWMIGSAWAILCWIGAQLILKRQARSALKPPRA